MLLYPLWSRLNKENVKNDYWHETQLLMNARNLFIYLPNCPDIPRDLWLGNN